MMFIRVVELDVAMKNKPGVVERISCTQMIQLGHIQMIDQHLDKYKVTLPMPPVYTADNFWQRLKKFAKRILPFWKNFKPLPREQVQQFDPIHQELVKRLGPSLAQMGVQRVFFARSRACNTTELVEFFSHRYSMFEHEGTKSWKRYLKDNVW